MTTFTLIRNKLISLLLILLGVSLLSFVFSHISPVDPAEALAQRTLSRPTAEQIAQLRQEMGLDKPLWVQYFSWLTQALGGDFGTSLLTGRPVLTEVAGKLTATFPLVLLSMAFTLLITLPVSIASAVRKNGLFDQAARIGTIVGLSLPNFWLGFMLLALFAVSLPLFKVVEYGNLRSLILPALALAIPMACSFIRVFRSNLIRSYQADFITYARACGLPERKITALALKSALPPMVTLFFQSFGYTLAGSAMVEAVFSWPGIGSYLVQAIIGRDLPGINACVLIFATFFVLLNFAAELINLAIQPTLRSSGEACHD
ncbi:ABC transporter permease [Desulfitobacterium chlororespirans]|uniref:Nickel transport system permease protein n=1 Tax=Desulfitobacterium chlororespirans DSM 11544 TaxID=1121395 RepID=A0A1M7TIU3_9FIRM|nr:ABC transporter permease [Desulfitobacterium chlororespirans]SHN70538.1 nickel transport system permease protein [Desulfitobacterium chlororespirans DSM 11544]